MIENLEYIKLGFAVITSIGTTLGIYHKFVMKKIDEKVDQKLHDTQVEFMRTQMKDNYENFEKRFDAISKDMKIIMEYILNKK